MPSSFFSPFYKSLARWKFWDSHPTRAAAERRPRQRLNLEALEDRCVPSATIKGTVFEDFNASGAQVVNGTINNAGQGTVGVASDPGMAGVTVTAYNAAGTAVAATTTAANGVYTLTDPAGTAATPYRIEFTNLPAGFTDGPEGAGSGSSVQFVTGSTNNVDLGLLQASEYAASSNPTLYSQIYHTGDPSLPGTITLGNGQTYTPSANASEPALVSFSYSAGTAASDTTLTDYQTPGTHTISVPVSAIGSTFGLAFNPVAQQLYASAYTKRFASYGPGAGGLSNGDPGAIYMIDPTTGAVSLFASIPNMTNFRALTGPGDTPYTNNSSYESDNGSDPTNPNLGWQSVGTTSLGGMDINAAGTQLYVMDLQHRTLDILGIKADGTWDGTLTTVAIPIPTDASAAANMEPFAVHYYNGLVYIGEVDSAQSTQNAAQLRGYVFTFNPATNTFNPNQVLEFSLNYARGSSYGGSDDFHPWAASYQNINGTQSGDGPTKDPQPMLTGIAFDAAGNMTLGIRDRNGDQTTRFLESDPGHDPNTQEGISAGATLRAAPNAGLTAWTLENNGSSGGVATGGAGSGFGPGGGMYYYQDNYDNSDTVRNQNGNGHNDVTLGGVEQVPGFPDVVVTSFDPDQNSGSAPGQSASYRTGGIRWFHDGNDALGNAGTDTKAYMLYSIDAPGTFGKADGVGNVVAQTFPAPLEIGNRVWEDLNGNGIQDAGEPVLPNVTVTLFDVTAGNIVGTTTTDPNGDYLFNNSNVTGGLLPNHAYEVRISTAQANLAGLGLTRANVGPDPLVNSKGTLAGGNAVIAVTTGAPGQIDHAEDAGFEPLAQVAGVVFDDTVENDGVFHAATDPGINGVTVTLTGTDDLGNPVSLSTTTSTIGGQAGSYLFSGLQPSNAAGYVITETGLGVPATFIDGKDSVPGSLGGAQANQYADQVTAILVTAGANGVNYDFGEIKAAQVAGVVFDNSVENDGVFHAATDPGINGVTVTLTGADDQGNPVSLSTTTSTIGGQAGSYLFSGLRPSNGAGYTITETGVGVPATFIDGKDSVPGSLGGSQANQTADQVTAIVVHAGANGVNYNFGEIQPAQVAGVVFDNTVENDGVFHAKTDPGINGVTVTLAGTDDQGNPVSLSTTTSTIGGQAGSYLFSGLRPSNAGGYAITETGVGVPATFIDGKDSVPGSLGGAQANQYADQVTAIPVIAGANGVNYDFGEIKAAQVAGVVFDNSVENDGVFHAATDPGINGVTVTLTGTDDLGNPVSLTTTTSTIGGQAGSYVLSGLHPSNGAGYMITETGLGVPATFIDGKDSVPGSLGGAQANQYADQVTAIVVHANDSGVSYNFGEIKPAQVAGVVFDNSVENDGVFHSATDPGINGVTVTLTGTDDLGNPVSLTTTTSTLGGQAGSYLFSGLRPSNGAGYVITETGVGVPASFIDGKDSVPGSLGGAQANQFADQVTAIPVTAGANGVNYNFGEIQPAAAVSGVVFSDYNNDGVENGPDQGIAGVTITLTGTNRLGLPVSQTTTTAPDGSYHFTGLLPGNYTVTETQPVAYFDGKDILGSAGGTNAVKNQFANIALSPGQNGVAYNFAEVPMVDPTGTVYVDLNNNGILDPGEPGVPGVTVTLTGSDVFGHMIARTTLTDGNGAYQFAGLAPGVYSIADTQPVGYIPGAEQNGSPPAAAVAPNQFIGIDLTRAPFFGSGYNFGELLGGFAGAVVPALIAPTGPEVQPTFISKTLLLGSGLNGALAGNVAYVNILYDEVLFRPVDVPALNYWVFQLDSGVSRTQVADAIWRSAEHRGLEVDRFYQIYLHRPADPAGRAFVVNEFLNGATESQVALNFLTSTEYLTDHLGASALVASMYQDVLGRPVDAGSLAYWVAALGNGASVQTLALDLLYSTESLQGVINRIYIQFLGRGVDSGADSVDLPLLQQGGQSIAMLADSIISSDEFFNRFS